MSRRTIMPFLVMYFIVTAMMIVSPSYADTKLHEGDKPSICPPSEGDKGGGGEDGWPGAVQKYTQQLCDICRAKCHFALHDAYQNMPPTPIGDQYLGLFGQPGAGAIDAPKKANIQASFGKFPLYFIQNDGQIDNKVKFYEQGSGHAMYFTERGVYLSFAGRRGTRGRKAEGRSKRQEAGCTMRDAGGSRKFKIKNAKCKVQNQKSETLNSKHETLNTKPETCSSKSEVRNPQSAIVRLFPLGGNKHPEIVAEGLQGGKVNYLTGNDPSKWKSNIPTYNAVVYKEVYKGIDIKFYGNNQQLEYDIIVKAGANPSRVRFAYQGIDGMRVTDGGDLEISVNGGTLIQKKPHIYQEIDGRRVEIEGRFKIQDRTGGMDKLCLSGGGKKEAEARGQNASSGRSRLLTATGSSIGGEYTATGTPERRGAHSHAEHGNEVELAVQNPKSKIRNPQFFYAFHVASYDKHHPLVIDPAIVYSTYLEGSGGGKGADYGNGIAVDAEGNAYITGYTDATNYPNKSAVYGSNAGGYDVFITKIDTSGNSLVYSTYLGGSDNDYGYGIAVDTDGNAYVTGSTESDDFPTASPIYSKNTQTYAGDAFVTKLDAKGEKLVYSTYLGGRYSDVGNGIAVDIAGNAYVTGYTGSDDFPTASAIYGSNAGSYDAFVTKLNASGSSLSYSTYLGGSNEDYGNGIAVDTEGNSYVTGYTASKDFPTVSAIYNKKSKSYDAFVTKLDAKGKKLVYSSYLGGSSGDWGNGIAVDTEGNAYVTGYTYSKNFPTASAIYSKNAGDYDVFVTKLDVKGKKVVYSTYLGGSDYDHGNGIAVDTDGNAYVTGYTESYDFPTASALYSKNAGGWSDVFVTKLNTKGKKLVYSSYLGGSIDWDYGNGIAVDADGNAYVTGYTESYDFPTASAIYGSNTGYYDAFVTKLSATGGSLIYSTYLGGSGGEEGNAIAVDTEGNVYTTANVYSYDFPTASPLYESSGNFPDIIVTKLSASGNSLVYSTYLGGNNDDRGNGIAVDADGNAYITGHTNSDDFPTASALYGSKADGFRNAQDAFVTKLNASGNSLVYSTYLGGGSDNDYGNGIAVDADGNAYVTGYTGSYDFPTASAIYGSNTGLYDAFVTKLNASGSSLVYSTYLGGSAWDYGEGIAVDIDGNAYVTGHTESGDFPTASALYGSYAGSNDVVSGDVFVTKLNATGNSLVYSTYLGGSGDESGKGIAVDASGNAYVTGYTWSDDFPTASALYGSKASYYDAFVTKLNASGSSLIYSTYLGGSGGDYSYNIAVDAEGNAYVTGNTGSADFPTASAIYEDFRGGQYDAFVTKLNASGSSLEYSTYLGGWDSDEGSGIAVDTDGNAYVTGTTYSSNFPTKSAYDSNLDGGPAVFVTKIGSESSTTTDTYAPAGSITINDGASYTNSTAVTLTLSATDNVGVTGYYISEGSTAPSASDSGWTSVSSTTGYNETLSYSLSIGEGSKTLYAWFKDNADNVSDTASAAIIVDTTLPLVTISSPTSSSTYTSASSTISLGGSASDSSSITGVTWSNSRGGNGTATGTASWIIAGIFLSVGDNVITVTAVDNAGNTGTDAITVTYNVSIPTPTPTPTPTPAQTPTPKPSDTTPPDGSVTINSGASYTNSSAVTLDISASDSVGVTGYYIAASSSTPSASASGWNTITSTTSFHDTISYTISGSDGAKTVYAWYKDAGGNVSSTASDDITLDTASPTTTITSPTSGSAYTTTSSTISISGSASDGASGINGVTWSSSRGESGAASGTTSWTVSNISLSVGDTTITVTAKDGAGNSGTDTITITYKVTTPTPEPSPTPSPTSTPSSTPVPGTIYGLVYDPDGNLLKGVAVAIQHVSTDFSDSETTNDSGFYHFIELTPGKYLLTYTKSSYRTHTEEAELEEDGAVRVEVNMEAVKVGSIYGYTVDINGDPVEGVGLNLKGLKTGASDYTASDMDGYFRFEELEPDTYSIIAKKKRYKQETEQVTLEEGESKKVEFEMNRTSKRIIDERQTAETQRR